MKKISKILLAVVCFILIIPTLSILVNVGASLTKGDDGKDGVDGLTPYIGSNGNWWIGNDDTGIAVMPSPGSENKVLRSYQGKWYSVYPSLLAPGKSWYKSEYDRTLVTTINIVDTYTPDGTEDETWNGDHDNLGLVKCYRKGSDIIIAGNGYGKISANMDSTSMFDGFESVTKMDGIDVLDVSSVVSAFKMFNKCKSITTLDLSSFDTNNVTDMSAMFQFCESLAYINLDGWKTDKVTNMRYMFSKCHNLVELDLSHFLTKNVTNMSNMFQSCYLLSVLDISSFDTSNVTSMGSMFYHCYSLEVIDVSNFDTGNVVMMESMFGVGTHEDDGESSKLRNIIGIDKFDLSKVESTDRMFYGAAHITHLPISGWDMRNVKTVSHMFTRCTRLSNATVQSICDNWQLDSCISMNGLFNSCKALTEIDVSNLLKPACTELLQMFEKCDNLAVINGLDKWNTSNVLTMQEMFSECPNIEVLDLSSFNTRGLKETVIISDETVSAMNSMFAAMTKLKQITLGKDFIFHDGITLPTPSSEYIENATGKWKAYDEKGVLIGTFTSEEISASQGGSCITYVAEVSSSEN